MALDPRDGLLPGGAAGAAATAALREELQCAQAETAAALAECKRLSTVLAKVGDQPKVALAERVTNLELRLARSERERTEVEERLAAAFTQVIRELEEQIERLEDEGAGLRAEVRRAAVCGERGAAAGGSAGSMRAVKNGRGVVDGSPGGGTHGLSQGVMGQNGRRTGGGAGGGGLSGFLPTFARKLR